MEKSIELIIINDHTDVDEEKEYETSCFNNGPSLELKDSGRKINIKGRKLLDMDSDIYFLDPKSYRYQIAKNAKIYLENTPENTKIILLTWEYIYLADLGAQSLIARFYGPKMKDFF